MVKVNFSLIKDRIFSKDPIPVFSSKMHFRIHKKITNFTSKI